jgi:hypothetical protein
MCSQAKLYQWSVLQTLPLAGMIFMMQQAETNADARLLHVGYEASGCIFASQDRGMSFTINEFFVIGIACLMWNSSCSEVVSLSKTKNRSNVA